MSQLHNVTYLIYFVLQNYHINYDLLIISITFALFNNSISIWRVLIKSPIPHNLHTRKSISVPTNNSKLFNFCNDSIKYIWWIIKTPISTSLHKEITLNLNFSISLSLIIKCTQCTKEGNKYFGNFYKVHSKNIPDLKSSN